MRKTITINLIAATFLLLSVYFSWADGLQQKGCISVKGDLVSIAADNVLLSEVFGELEKKCNVEIKTVGGRNMLSSTPVSMHSSELTIDNAVKKLLNAAGIRNYYVERIRKKKPELDMIKLCIIGGSGANRPTVLTALPQENESDPEEQIQPSLSKDTEPDGDPETFAEKVEWVKNSYAWQDNETMELAGHLFEIMPEQKKDLGLNIFVRKLDERIEQEKIESIDEELLLQAIVATVPAKVAPVMQKHMQKYIEDFKGRGDLPSEKTPTEHYRDFFSKNQHQ